MTRTPLKRIGKRGRARAKAWKLASIEAMEMAGGWCVVREAGCQNFASEGHHILPRSRGGRDTVENCLSVCHPCHMRIHANPAWAKEKGYLQ